MKGFTLFLAELQHRFWLIVRYPVETISDILLFSLLTGSLFLVRWVLAPEQYTPTLGGQMLYGFLTLYIADGCLLSVTRWMANDALLGTMERLMLTCSSLSNIITARFGVAMVWMMMKAGLIAAVISRFVPVAVPRLPLLLIIITITMGSILGLTWLLCGLQLRYKIISSLIFVISTMLFFTTGAISPINASYWTEASYIIPLTLGISAGRTLLGEPELSLFPLLLPTMLHALISLSVGYMLLQHFTRKTAIDGSFGTY